MRRPQGLRLRLDPKGCGGGLGGGEVTYKTQKRTPDPGPGGGGYVYVLRMTLSFQKRLCPSPPVRNPPVV